MHRNASIAHLSLVGLLVLCLGLMGPLTATAEERHPLEGRLSQGEAVWLDVGEASVFAVARRPDRPEARGGALLIGGRGEHPESPGVIAPLRRTLADHGWFTLAMARPPEEESAAHIRAGLNWLVDAIDAGQPKLVVLGHGRGALNALRFTAEHGGDPELHALVMVNVNPPMGEAGDAALLQLEALELPVLDIFFQQGPRPVRDTAEERRRSARRGGNDHYRQDALPGRSRAGLAEDALTRRVQGWLRDPTGQRRERFEEAEMRRAPARSEREQREAENPEDNDALQRYFTPPGAE